MNKFTQITISIILAAILLCSAVSVAASSKISEVTGQNMYTITYDYGFDGNISYATYEEGEYPELPEEIEKEGYILYGWYINRYYNNAPFDFSQPVTDDRYLYARYILPSDIINIYFYTTNSDFPYNITDAVAGDYLIPEIPEKEGLFFAGWYCEPELINKFDFDRCVFEDTHLYAKFVPYEDVAVVYTYMPGEATYSDRFEVEKGSSVYISEPYIEDMYFDGWFLDDSYSIPFDASQPILENTNLYAKFISEEDMCYVNIYLDGTEPIASGLVKKGTYFSIDDPGMEDMVFVGWYCEPERINKFDFSKPITEEVSIYAKFVPDADYQLGDVDGDGEIAVMDATLIQRSLVRQATLTAEQELRADTYKDSEISVMDATRIQRFLARLITEF